MKIKEKQKAIMLRKRGKSMGDIAQILGVSKSSVSYWVRDVELSSTQRNALNANGHSIDAIEKRRIARLAGTATLRASWKQEAFSEVSVLQHDTLWCLGVALYWGEGGKTQQTARLSNSDTSVIKLIMRFFRESCKAKEEKFRGHIHTFSHKNKIQAEQYWSEITGIPRERFYKTYTKKSSASKNKRNTLPYGTVQIYVHDTQLFFRIMGWIEKLKELENI